ncbi:MAG: hypothetical protein HWN66_03460 [Candidatus Helarchaeota archaeon]|nr:hypothetical protein [Candidatus Helarchaeota archaeon]
MFELNTEFGFFYRKHLIKELERIDKKIQELREKEEFKEAFHDIDIQ